MQKEDLPIFPFGEEKKLTENEYHNAIDSYEQQVRLFGGLKAWSCHAMEVMKKKGYSDFCFYGGAYKFPWHPQSIPLNADSEAKSADRVLRATHNLYEAYFYKDQCRIANAGIALGLAISSAHAEPFEKIVVEGVKSKEGWSKGGRQRKESFGINGKVRQLKQDNQGMTVKKIWVMLVDSASREESVEVDGVTYNLCIERIDITDASKVKVKSIKDVDGMPDGKGIAEGRFKNKFKNI